MPITFLDDHPTRRGLPLSASGLTPVAAFDGRGDHPLEVALATSAVRPRADAMRRAWKGRHGGTPSPLLLTVAYEVDGAWKASICGPAGDEPPVEADLDLDLVERIAAAALEQPSRNHAIRFLGGILAEIESELPGIRNHGMLATQELRDGVPQRSDWAAACERSRPLLGSNGRELVERLGFHIEHHSIATTILSVGDARRAVAVFLEETEEFEAPAARFGDTSPVTHALAQADRAELPWVVVTRGAQIRLYSAKPDVGVGRKGRADTYVEANLALVPGDSAGYVSLLFSAEALGTDGTLTEILETSRDHAAALGLRLRDRVYENAVPDLALALAKRYVGSLDEPALAAIYEQALTVLFRLLFVAYAEDKDLLPYRSNGAYRDHALKTRARELAERQASGSLVFDGNATDLWDEITGLWTAVDKGNVERGVPPYNGGLFSTDPTVNKAGSALAGLTLTNAEFGPPLVALLLDEGDDTVVGPVDFRSLSVREFGTIYEGLLESNLSVAPNDLALDTKRNYVPASTDSEVAVEAGAIYFHNRSGERKASGSYFTKPFAVEHLLDHALEPALDEHLLRVAELVEASEEARAAEAFFDFRCVDLAMGSGHFLVAAVDRIEARLSGFLALHPIPRVTAELDRLRAAAYGALGPLGEGVEIEHASLLRRQVARRCIYGIDLNPVATELARLAIWIHTFVPGLPLSFLDHSLVVGNSLTGIGTLDEAVEALDPGSHKSGTISFLSGQLAAVLERSGDALKRLARATDASASEVAEARAAQDEAKTAVQPVQDLCDLVVAARLGEVTMPTAFDAEVIGTNLQLAQARQVAEDVGALHLPVAFPEVFLRERSGFDCLLGNPPWDTVKIEEQKYFGVRFPGLRSMETGAMSQAIGAIKTSRLDVAAEYERRIRETERYRSALLKGPYPGLGTGDPDLSEVFAWRYWQLARDQGWIGVVLPRSILMSAGTDAWRLEVLRFGQIHGLVTLINTGGWVFDDAEPRYTIAFITMQRTAAPATSIKVFGPYRTLSAFQEGMRGQGAELVVEDIVEWTPGAALPLLPSEEAASVYRVMRAFPSWIANSQPWAARTYRELDSSLDRVEKGGVIDLGAIDTEGLWPVYKGESFRLWEPATGVVYGWADPDRAVEHLVEKRERQVRNRRSAFYGMSGAWASNPSTLPCMHPRIAWRKVARATDTRSFYAVLLPPRTLTADHNFLVFFPDGNAEREEAFLLGVFCSLPFDWHARLWVEANFTFNVVQPFPVPPATRDDALRRRIEEIAGRLAAVDERYEDWAAAVGVAIGGVADAEERVELVTELDALVARLYGLDEKEIRLVFETFHDGWDYTPRLEHVLTHFRELV